MTDTLDRTELTARLSEQFDALADLVSGLDENRWRTPSPLPGWTVFDVLSHVIGTESLLLGDEPPARDPQSPDIDVETLPHVRNEIGVLNEIWVQRLRPRPGAELLDLYREVTGRRRAALGAMDDAAWTTPSPSPIGEVPYARFMRVRLFDCWMHELDIADALGEQVDEGGTRGELAFAEFARSLPRVVAKRGKAPAGSLITLELTGPLARTLHIEIGDRARYTEAPAGEPTVRVELDSGLLVRLGGGRVDAESALDRITFRGDSGLGHQVVRNLAFTI
ncbi:maleylpyruvate isomerase family mycothiol-dependent enzyme [Nocardia sp. NBC_01329]|uniref:maleylpyruvate isomerase family mycothiol-dependent enzyme n=1 Tax=Nocardia sp. NBC_01329 TaxID=2903594 RepID=UPI002E12FC39|nr:maleylpyruvate isomerase family mycothiol-dependent enzyme [Nocardia sp. NBC_01329]